MRQISVSTDVFAKIWSLREPGEDAEDSILRRVLGCPPKQIPTLSPPNHTTLSDIQGVQDPRNGVNFPEGFEIYRNYLGVPHRARATAGIWVLEANGRSYKSLNDLSRAVGAKTENAWVNWFFTDADGIRQPVSRKRQPEMIGSRTRTKWIAPTADHVTIEEVDMNATWLDDVIAVMNKLGGPVHLSKIYQHVEAFRKSVGRSVPRTIEEVIRKTLEENSSDSDAYKGRRDVFYLPEGKGTGVWALR